MWWVNKIWLCPFGSAFANLFNYSARLCVLVLSWLLYVSNNNNYYDAFL